MATTTDNAPCLICEKEKTALKCSGCLIDFCFHYLVEYCQQLSKRLDKLETKGSFFDRHLQKKEQIYKKIHLLKFNKQQKNL
jgi:hypothetical protein